MTKVIRVRKKAKILVYFILILLFVFFTGLILVLQTNNNSKKQTETIAETSTTEDSEMSLDESRSTKPIIENDSGHEKQSEKLPESMKIVSNILIINKKYSLPASYNPGENFEAKNHFLRLKQDMQKLGFPISDSYSGYRSYGYQEQLYKRYVSQNGQAAADTFSARPGHSEHQSGLAYDLINLKGQLLGSDNSEYDSSAVLWLAENVHKYGFIVRYLPGKQQITGYQPEPWHIRYVGGIAEEIYKSGKTLEEFLGVEGGDYN